MITYLLLASVGVFIFWAYYKLALRNVTHFNLIRVYFVCAILLSLLVPLMDEITLENKSSESLEQNLNEVSFDTILLNEVASLKQKLGSVNSDKKEATNWLFLIYIGGCSLLFIKILYSLLTLYKVQRSSEKSLEHSVPFYYNERIRQPFSLFRSIYLPKLWKDAVPPEVIDHELVHIRQQHFIDLLFSEFLLIILWFNPFAYLLKKELRANLEFIADEAVINKGRNVCHYQSLLLSVATNGDYQAPLKLYFNVPLKNRIVMMSKKKTSSIGKMTLLGILPITIILFALTTSKEIKAPVNEFVQPIVAVAQDNKPSILPLDKNAELKVTSHFGTTMHPTLKFEKLHTGIDLRAAMGTPVYATSDGLVEAAEFNEHHGYFIKIKHSEKYQTKYSHLKSFIVVPNTFVTKGQVIGYTGSSGRSTGPHLHFEVHENGLPVDPRLVLKELDDC